MSGTEDRRLGVLIHDRGRSLVVVSRDGELAVALRDALPRQAVLVRDARPDDVAAVVRACLPWPWMLCGDVASLDAEVLQRLRSAPVLVVWLHSAPAQLPLHARSCRRFSDVVDVVSNALSAEVAGMRLAPGLGVTMPDGAWARSAALEALVGAHPHGFFASLRQFRSAARTLALHRVALQPRRSDGVVRLAHHGSR